MVIPEEIKINTYVLIRSLLVELVAAIVYIYISTSEVVESSNNHANNSN